MWRRSVARVLKAPQLIRMLRKRSVAPQLPNSFIHSSTVLSPTLTELRNLKEFLPASFSLPHIDSYEFNTLVQYSLENIRNFQK